MYEVNRGEMIVMSKQLVVAIVGATGAVGSKLKEQLIKRNFPIKHIKFLASSSFSWERNRF